MFFPHTRGWSYVFARHSIHLTVFPAHAGVILNFELRLARRNCFSRTRGGDPASFDNYKAVTRFFPHTRGWSQRTAFLSPTLCVFPAHAGVIPNRDPRIDETSGFSRTRGGDPSMYSDGHLTYEFFPHTRGWSLATLFACPIPTVFPAHAGVIPHLLVSKKLCLCFSRTRGGDPTTLKFDYNTAEFFPHTRGWS